MEDPVEVVPSLYLGSQAAAANRAVLDAKAISCVVNTAREIPSFFKQDGIGYFAWDRKAEEGEPREADTASTTNDGALSDCSDDNISEWFGPCNAYITECRRQGNGVLVHCQAGISRSSSIVIAHLIMHEGMTLKDAFLLVKSKRANVQPNIHFFQALQTLEVSVHPSLQGPSFDVGEYYIEVLADMGFSRDKAAEALNNSQNDFNLAVTLCLSA